MNTVDILIPFGLPPAEMAADLTRSMATPGLATLLSRAKSATASDMDPFSRALPHEAWIARQFGVTQRDSLDGLPLAFAAMQVLDIPAEPGFWFLLQPAHLHVARDHLVLTDLRRLALSEQDSRVLFQSIQSLFEESGKTLIYGDARTWFLRADDWAELSTSTPAAASGHNIDIWMPRGPGEREWRKLLNEVQMTWYAHPLNAEREMSGELAVNSLWLWGGAQENKFDGQSRYQQMINPLPWMPSSELANSRVANAEQIINSSTANALVILDDLMDAAMASDWSTWLSAMHQMENEWMLPLLETLRNGKIGEIRFILSHSTRLLEIVSGKNSVKKFWIKPSLAPLTR
ncbi:MAG: hypothetical protein ACO1NO_14790 [Burkholderiaceae bacterium]